MMSHPCGSILLGAARRHPDVAVDGMPPESHAAREPPPTQNLNAPPARARVHGSPRGPGGQRELSSPLPHWQRVSCS
eukprot:3213102-Pyramimonas_sp.AAC.1